jgi:hypothetical protein
MTWLGRPARAALRYAVAGLAAAAVLVVLDAGPAGAAPSPGATDSSASVKYYVVADQYHGEPEFLFEIAERFLGSGDRAMEIFNLNKGRLEPGGAKVSKPEVIRPRWALRLPADAKGTGVQVGKMPDFSSEAEAADPSATPAPASADAATPAPFPADAAAPASTRWLLPLVAVLLLAALLAAAAILFIRRKRHPGSATAAVTPPRTAAYESSGAWIVGRAVRALATACAQQSRPIPAVGALILGPESVVLRLATPDEAPPPGWSLDDQGRTWRMTLEQLQNAPVDSTIAEPFPRLVSLGDTSAGRVLLNLAQADGVISLEGDAGRARYLARTWASRLTTSPWSAGIPVVRVGFDHDPADGFTGVEASRLEEATGVLDGSDGGVLVFAEAPHGRDLDYVTWLVGEKGWSVVAVEARDARWRLRVDSAGTVESGLLDEPALLRA